MRAIVLFFLTLFGLHAGNLEITANNFYHKDGDNKAEFNGNAVAKQDGNLIKSNKIVVLLDEKSEAKEYIASGNVYFELKSSNKFIKGTCVQIKYIPTLDKYFLNGNVAIEDVKNKRKVYGDEIIIDNKNGSSYAKSNSKKPVKFIFKVKSNAK